MITAVPQELIEQVLVIAAKDGFPQAVASLCQTCRHFYNFLGVRNDNRHLWHALFLAIFEDPRLPEGSYDWKQQFIDRMSLARRLNKVTNESELLRSLRTLVAAVTTENSVMYSAAGDSFEMYDATLFGAPSPLSGTRLTYPLVIVLHALESQWKLHCPSSVFALNETWGLRLLDSIRSSTSAWAEDVLQDGYPAGLADRLLTFDPWAHRRRNRDRKQKQTSTPPSIADDPEWEVTEAGRLFYKLVYMKGPLLERTSTNVERSKVQMRLAARKRVYDMRYLRKQRLYGPFHPVDQPLTYGIPQRPGSTSKGKQTIRSTSSSDEGSEEETAQIHLDMLSLLSAGIHPHFLLHHHLIHPAADPFSGDPLDIDEAVQGPNQHHSPPHRFKPENVSPHRIVPDYPFLSAAKYLIEANMKETWGNLITIAQDVMNDGDSDSDEDGDYNDEGEGEGEGDDTENDGDDEENEGEEENAGIPIPPEDGDVHVHVPGTQDSIQAFAAEPSASQTVEPTEAELVGSSDDEAEAAAFIDQELSAEAENTRRRVDRLVDSFSYLDFVRMGGAAGYWKDGIKERWEALRNRWGEEFNGKNQDGVVDGWDWAGVEGEWRRVVCWMDYQDLLLHSSGTGRTTENESDINEAIRLFPITLHITGYSPPPPRPIPPSTSSSTSIQDESADPDALIWHLPVIHFSGQSQMPNDGSGMPAPIRKLRGTVKMIGDGAVLWTMTSSYVGQDDPEWAVNGVQIGCIGSAAGFVGMWTGAEHTRGDPIGPSWQWKVA